MSTPDKNDSGRGGIGDFFFTVIGSGLLATLAILALGSVFGFVVSLGQAMFSVAGWLFVGLGAALA